MHASATRLVIGALLLSLLSIGVTARAGPDDGRRCAEIHEAIAARGIPVTSVTCRDGRFELVLGPTCTQVQRTDAERIKDEVLSAPPATIVVDTLDDALVVLRFEPRNESANRLVKQRYDALRSQARQR